MSDLTPEETPIPDWQFAAREEDRIAWAVAAAVAAERERLGTLARLLADEIETDPGIKDALVRDVASDTLRSFAIRVAREGDTTGSNK